MRIVGRDGKLARAFENFFRTRLIECGPIAEDRGLRLESADVHADLFVRVTEVGTNGRSVNVSDGFVRLGPDDANGTVRLQLDALAHPRDRIDRRRQWRRRVFSSNGLLRRRQALRVCRKRYTCETR